MCGPVGEHLRLEETVTLITLCVITVKKPLGSPASVAS